MKDPRIVRLATEAVRLRLNDESLTAGQAFCDALAQASLLVSSAVVRHCDPYFDDSKLPMAWALVERNANFLYMDDYSE